MIVKYYTLDGIINRVNAATERGFETVGTGKDMRLTDADGGSYAAKGEKEVTRYMQGILCGLEMARAKFRAAV